MKTRLRLLTASAGFVAILLLPTGAEAAPADPALDVPASGAAVVVDGPGASHTYRIAADVPAGGSLTPATGQAGAFASEVLVRNAKGVVVGAYDAPYAVGANGELVTGTYRIEGTTLVESVPVGSASAYPLTVLLAGYRPVGTVLDQPSRDRSALAVSQVTVPSNYVYNPALGSLHDYCTSSPDSYLAADFRGPCARHDLCYDAPGDNKLNCDNKLYEHLGTNCTYAYPTNGTLRNTCLGVAATYWAAVTTFGNDPL
ncbi:phospholipase A2 [Actinoplanes couchii]|uniref:Phospholipase A2 n=1 Tax=Actinoplanes couchii TaxID=403638 RepID=A0ABQ3XTI8_9ACTN|nr:phospholipase A2 [Actinoplanes couchii]MDR6324155.1 hypothetical protein [Actinoplanes couchii]GID61773.1 hypothetical protein Aco03nite_101770 [Actinoplanes couchii]